MPAFCNLLLCSETHAVCLSLIWLFSSTRRVYPDIFTPQWIVRLPFIKKITNSSWAGNFCAAQATPEFPSLLLQPAECVAIWVWAIVPCLVICKMSTFCFLKLHSVALGSFLTQLCQLEEVSEFTCFSQASLPQGLFVRFSLCLGSLWLTPTQDRFLTSFRALWICQHPQALPWPSEEMNPPVLAPPVHLFYSTIFDWCSSSPVQGMATRWLSHLSRG